MTASNAPDDTDRSVPAALLRSAVGILGLSTLISFLGQQLWVAEVLTNFRDYYTVGLLGCVLSALYLRRPVSGSVALGLLLTNLWFVVPPMLQEPLVKPLRGPAMHLLNLNVYRENRARHEVASYLEHSGADAIVVQEIHLDWVRALQRGLPSYVPVLVEPRDDSHFGIGLYLRREGPLRAERAELFFPDPSRGHPAIAASLRAGQYALQMLAVHVHPPMGQNTASQRRTQARNLAKWLAARSGPRVMLGDTNMTPYSPVYASLIQDSGLMDARRGRGTPFTWFPVAALPFGLPLDTCLHSAELTVQGLWRGPWLGSDHRPVHVRLGFNQPATAARGPESAYQLQSIH